MTLMAFHRLPTLNPHLFLGFNLHKGINSPFICLLKKQVRQPLFDIKRRKFLYYIKYYAF